MANFNQKSLSKRNITTTQQIWYEYNSYKIIIIKKNNKNNKTLFWFIFSFEGLLFERMDDFPYADWRTDKIFDNVNNFHDKNIKYII